MSLLKAIKTKPKTPEQIEAEKREKERKKLEKQREKEAKRVATAEKKALKREEKEEKRAMSTAKKAAKKEEKAAAKAEREAMARELSFSFEGNTPGGSGGQKSAVKKSLFSSKKERKAGEDAAAAAAAAAAADPSDPDAMLRGPLAMRILAGDISGAVRDSERSHGAVAPPGTWTGTSTSNAASPSKAAEGSGSGARPRRTSSRELWQIGGARASGLPLNGLQPRDARGDDFDAVVQATSKPRARFKRAMIDLIASMRARHDATIVIGEGMARVIERLEDLEPAAVAFGRLQRRTGAEAAGGGGGGGVEAVAARRATETTKPAAAAAIAATRESNDTSRAKTPSPPPSPTRQQQQQQQQQQRADVVDAKPPSSPARSAAAELPPAPVGEASFESDASEGFQPLRASRNAVKMSSLPPSVAARLRGRGFRDIDDPPSSSSSESESDGGGAGGGGGDARVDLAQDIALARLLDGSDDDDDDDDQVAEAATPAHAAPRSPVEDVAASMTKQRTIRPAPERAPSPAVTALAQARRAAAAARERQKQHQRQRQRSRDSSRYATPTQSPPRPGSGSGSGERDRERLDARGRPAAITPSYFAARATRDLGDSSPSPSPAAVVRARGLVSAGATDLESLRAMRKLLLSKRGGGGGGGGGGGEDEDEDETRGAVVELSRFDVDAREAAESRAAAKRRLHAAYASASRRGSGGGSGSGSKEKTASWSPLQRAWTSYEGAAGRDWRPTSPDASSPTELGRGRLAHARSSSMSISPGESAGAKTTKATRGAGSLAQRKEAFREANARRRLTGF